MILMQNNKCSLFYVEKQRQRVSFSISSVFYFYLYLRKKRSIFERNMKMITFAGKQQYLGEKKEIRENIGNSQLLILK